MVCQNRQSKNTASGSLQPKKGIFDTYSLFIENIGKNVKNTTIEVYRNEPNTQTLYFLFNSTDSPISNHSTTFTHENFPIDVRAGKIEVVVKWEEKQYNHNKHPECAGRVYKQTFVFTEE